MLRNFAHIEGKIGNMLGKKIWAVLFFVLVVSGGTSLPSNSQNSAPGRPPVQTWTLAEAISETSNYTSVYYVLGHGTQIEYNAENGSSYLWYPGNRGIVVGKWKVESKEYGTAMCYQYGANTYNPETKKSGGKWECRNYQQGAFFKVDSREGDVFGLGVSGQVPYVLNREEVRPYIPSHFPFPRPYLTDGKSPIDHLLIKLSTIKGE